MFDLGWSELAFLAVLALVVVGPKDMPRLIRGAGKLLGKLQRFYREATVTMRRLENEIEVASSDGEPAYQKLLPEHVRQAMAKENAATPEPVAPQPERTTGRSEAVG